jgi:hypothetical protein
MTPDHHEAATIMAVGNELTELQLKYDTRILAVAMMQRSVHLLRCLVAAGKWRPEDAQVVATEALADLHVPLDTKPVVMQRHPGDMTD